ncbi:MAG TPA: hypothetical protein VK390_09660, partial [Propionibacteriaceae bacterium]|nr:hypothetical protein [Propionibacteriaceae bacterium]
RLTSWLRSSPTSRAGRSPHREVDEDEGVMTMIGPLVRVGIFEHQTDDLERSSAIPAPASGPR